jgi:hypothetical protein
LKKKKLIPQQNKKLQLLLKVFGVFYYLYFLLRFKESKPTELNIEIIE